MIDRKRRFAAVILISAMSLYCMAFGCNYHSMVVAEHDFKAGIGAFQQAEINEYNAGNIDTATHLTMETGIQNAALAGQNIANLLAKNAPKTSIATAIVNLDQTLQTLLNQGVLHVKNPTTQKTLQLSLQGVIDIVQNLSTEAGAPTATTLPSTNGGVK